MFNPCIYTHRIIYARFKSKKTQRVQVSLWYILIGYFGGLSIYHNDTWSLWEKRVLHGLPFEFYASAGKCTAYTWAPQGIEGGLGLRLQVRIDMGVAENKGPQYSTLNSRILILRTA